MNNTNLKGKLILVAFIVMLISLQHGLWNGKQNVIDLYRLNRHVDNVRKENQESRHRNDQLHEDIIDIKNRRGGIESRARFDLGLIKDGETYYHIVQSESGQND